MRRALRGAVGIAAAMGMAAGALAGDLPKAFEKAVGALPGKAMAALALRIDIEVARTLIDSLPMGTAYREVLEARCKKFAALTGFDPMQDIVGQALVVGAPGQGGPPPALLFVETAKNPMQLAGMLATDPMAQEAIKFQGPDRGMLGPVAFLVVPEGIWFGLKPVVAKMRTAIDPENAGLLARGLAAVPGKARFAITADVPPMGEPPPEGPPAILAKIRHVTLGKDAELLAVRAECADAAAAEALKGLIQGQLDQAKAKLAAPPPAEGGSPLQIFNPQAIQDDVQRHWATKLLESLALTVQGGTTVVLESRAEIFSSPLSFATIPALGVVSAIAIPNFIAARNRANERACFANQKTLSAALEMWALDTNQPVERLDAAMLKELKEKGYLFSELSDPGVKPPTAENYFLVSAPPGGSPQVACKVHGSIDGSVPPATGGPGAPEAPPAGVNIEGLMRSIFGGGGGGGPKPPSAFGRPPPPRPEEIAPEGPGGHEGHEDHEGHDH